MSWRAAPRPGAALAGLRRWAAQATLWRDALARRSGLAGPALAAILAGVVALALSYGAVPVPLAELPAAISDSAHPFHEVLWRVRFPRVAGGVLVGGALAAAGCLVQTAVQNPLADAGMLGVSAGAGLAAVATLLYLPGQVYLLPFLAFGGALAAVSLVFLSTAGQGAGNPLRLILAGVAIQAILFSLLALLTFFNADRAPEFLGFTVGTLHGTTWREVRLAALPVAIGIGVALAAARPFDLLLLDDATAGGLGLAARRARLGAAALACWLAAAAVAVAGLVGFVGLMVPNALRLAVGPRHRRLLPLAVLGGAALVVAADLAGRTLAAPVELPVGALLALLGGPYFLVLLWRRTV